MLKLCLIGDPVGHSRSPAIQNALLQKNGVEGYYKTVTVTPETLADFMADARAGAWDGFNVTMPLKTAILPLLDRLDETARAMGAVNTVAVRNGKATGYNTDGCGFVRSLPFSPAGKKVLLLGNGGAAHAVGYALRQAGAEVTVCARHPVGEEHPWNELCKLSETCHLLVNATSLGMSGKDVFPDLTFLERLPQGAAVYDLVYHPLDTALLQRAAALGYTAIGGLALLEAQAEMAFRIFSDDRPNDISAKEQ